jgi:predicted phosphoribosyltransferase
MDERVFRDRRDAGRVLAGLLDHYRGQPDVVVLGLPRGGVPVGYEVARALGAPLDIFLVRKLGVPGQAELAVGAIASGGVVVLNDDVVRGLGISPEVVRQVAEQEGRELLRRERAYRDGRPMPELTGKTVIAVDDGLAIGARARPSRRAPAATGPHRGRGAGRSGVHLPRAGPARRRGGLRPPAADDLGGPAQRKWVRPALADSVEELLHEVGEKGFLLSFAHAPRAADTLRSARLERAIGVIYRPQTERQSHYFRAPGR